MHCPWKMFRALRRLVGIDARLAFRFGRALDPSTTSGATLRRDARSFQQEVACASRLDIEVEVVARCASFALGVRTTLKRPARVRMATEDLPQLDGAWGWAPSAPTRGRTAAPMAPSQSAFTSSRVPSAFTKAATSMASPRACWLGRPGAAAGFFEARSPGFAALPAPFGSLLAGGFARRLRRRHSAGGTGAVHAEMHHLGDPARRQEGGEVVEREDQPAIGDVERGGSTWASPRRRRGR